MYQTYFSRTNLRRRKRQKPNTSNKVLATFLQLEKFVFLNYFELHVSNLNKKYTNMLRIKNSIDINIGKSFRSVLDSLIKKVLNMKFFVKSNLLQKLSLCKKISHHLQKSWMNSILFALFVQNMSDRRNFAEKIIQKIFFIVAKRPGSKDDQLI